jgi:type II secretory pathway component PulJ
MHQRNAFLYPEWQIPLQDALLEPDQAKLFAKLQTAEAGIAARLRQIGQCSGGRHEQEAMNHALTVLAALRRDNLAG